MARMVQCAKLGRPLPGLEKPPFPGELGRRIFEQVSEEAWRQWQSQLTIMINHYGLNLLDPATRAYLTPVLLAGVAVTVVAAVWAAYAATKATTSAQSS